MMRNFASRKDCGFQEPGGHSRQLHVAIRAVHDRLKLASQMHRMLTARHHEVRDVDVPLRVDMLQYAFKLALCRERSRNAMEYPEVRVLECVFTCHRRLPWKVVVLRTELAL